MSAELLGRIVTFDMIFKLKHEPGTLVTARPTVMVYHGDVGIIIDSQYAPRFRLRSIYDKSDWCRVLMPTGTGWFDSEIGGWRLLAEI